MFHEMKVSGFAVDPLSPRPVVLLKGEDSRTVPVWISTGEAVSMAAALVGRDLDAQYGRGGLLSAMIDGLQLTVVAIVIESLDDGMMNASVRIDRAGEEQYKLPVRASEALGASLRFRLPILVSDEVVRMASRRELDDAAAVSERDAGRYADFLEGIDPADLGKYPM
jgi:bifunctional DNase/RNase